MQVPVETPCLVVYGKPLCDILSDLADEVVREQSEPFPYSLGCKTCLHVRLIGTFQIQIRPVDILPMLLMQKGRLRDLKGLCETAAEQN